MHTRLLQVMPYPDSDEPEVQAIVRLSRSWHTVTEVRSGRRLTRVPGTPRWSHGGGLFADADGAQFTVQSLWPIVDEPDLWPDDEPEADSSPFSWRVSRPQVDPDAAARGAALDHAERRRTASSMRRPPADPADRFTVRLMPDYGVEWLLWGPEGPVEPWELALPADLTDNLRSWYDHWERSFHWDRGWASAGDERTHTMQGRSIAARLASAIEAFAVVEVPD